MLVILLRVGHTSTWLRSLRSRFRWLSSFNPVPCRVAWNQNMPSWRGFGLQNPIVDMILFQKAPKLLCDRSGGPFRIANTGMAPEARLAQKCCATMHATALSFRSFIVNHGESMTYFDAPMVFSWNWSEWCCLSWREVVSPARTDGVWTYCWDKLESVIELTYDTLP